VEESLYAVLSRYAQTGWKNIAQVPLARIQAESLLWNALFKEPSAI
jgi:hypothetical protein